VPIAQTKARRVDLRDLVRVVHMFDNGAYHVDAAGAPSPALDLKGHRGEYLLG